MSATSLLLVAAGGAAGSVLRFLVSTALASGLGTGFPYGTLAVNVAGSALIGAASGLGLAGDARLLLVTGFLGGFTTFSALSLETAALYERTPLLAALYVLLTLALGLGAFALTFHAIRR